MPCAFGGTGGGCGGAEGSPDGVSLLVLVAPWFKDYEADADVRVSEDQAGERTELRQTHCCWGLLSSRGTDWVTERGQ